MVKGKKKKKPDNSNVKDMGKSRSMEVLPVRG